MQPHPGKTEGRNLVRQTLQRTVSARKGIFLDSIIAVAQAVRPTAIGCQASGPDDTGFEKTESGLVFRHPVTKTELCIGWAKKQRANAMEVTIDAGKRPLLSEKGDQRWRGVGRTKRKQATFFCLNQTACRVRPMTAGYGMSKRIHQSDCQKLPASGRIGNSS